MEKHWEAESALGRPADGERGGHRFGPSSLSAYHSCAVITAEASPPPRSPHSLKTTGTTRCYHSNTSTASAVSALARIDCTNTDTEVGAVTRRLLFAHRPTLHMLHCLLLSVLGEIDRFDPSGTPRAGRGVQRQVCERICWTVSMYSCSCTSSAHHCHHCQYKSTQFSTNSTVILPHIRHSCTAASERGSRTHPIVGAEAGRV